MLVRSMTAAAAVLGLAAAFAPASAFEMPPLLKIFRSALPDSAPAPEVALPTEEVSYADLNLNNEAGAKVLLSRITNAAERVCGPKPDRLNLSQRKDYQLCVGEAVDSAIASLNNPIVTALNGGTPMAQPQGETAATSAITQ